ncbi:hypothetical protein KSP40_PGU015702 [Platanthera guangdongensis]|uniref:AB hydrolase-1 domain-containing protein n=1 Tax=Platanthera guangdongensis TaxID=2320717 RepID=A0ABR2LW42_9ASPA
MASSPSSLLSPISFSRLKFCRNPHEKTSPAASCLARRRMRRKGRNATVVGCSGDRNEDRGRDEKQLSFNPFGFFTDNPSSRAAIQLPETPAEDGNVGQMLYYVLKLEKADVNRLPYLASSGPGFALLEAARKADFRDILNRIATGFSSPNWNKQVLLAWGASDKYLPVSEAEAFEKANPEAVRLHVIEGAGHMPQEDWPEKVVEALRRFL